MQAGYALADTTVTTAETVKSVNFFQKAWKSITGLFSTAAPAAAVSSEIASAFGDELVDEATDAAKDGGIQAAENAKVAAYGPTKAALDALDIAAVDCPTAFPLVTKFTSAFKTWLITPIECCGGNGMSAVTWIALEKAELSVAAKNPYSAASLAAIRTKAQTKKLAAADIIAAQVNPAPPGTLGLQGPPLKSQFVSKIDIKVGGLFGGVVNFEDPKIKNMLEDRKEFMKIVMRSGIENFVLSTYTDKLMQNPKLYIETVAENSRKIDLLMDYFEKEVLDDINNNMAMDNYDKVQESMKRFVKKVSNLLVPKAHAIGGGMAMMAGGMLLQMVGSQIENPWVKEIFNIGSKLMLLQGLLGKLMKNYALNRPIGRSITWPIMSGLGIAIAVSLKKTEEKIQNNIEIVEKERQRFIDSAAARTGLSGNKVNGNSSVQLEKYDPTANLSNSMNIKACAVPNGNGFSPAMCPAVVPKQKFSLPELKGKMRNTINPDFLKGMSMMSKYARGVSSGSINGESMSDSDLDDISNLSNALAQHNAKLREEVDKHNSGIKTKDGRKLPNLKATIASFKRGFGSGSAGGSSAAPLASTGGEAYQRRGGKVTTNNVVNKGKKPTTSVGGGSVAAVKAPDFDLDFGDEDAGGVANADGTAADSAGTKGPEKLEDFVLKHDDINKRSEVPIWKILSNRYILSYPKILEEEDAKLEPEQVKDKKK